MDNKRFKICYLVSTLRKSGPTNQLYGLIKNLDRSIFSPIILTLSPEPQNSKYADFVKLDVEIRTLELSRIGMVLRGKKKLLKMIEKLQPDLIHTTGIRPDLYASKYLKGYIHCSTMRNYVFDDYPVKFGKIIGTSMAFIHISILSKIEFSISCSYAISNKLKRNHGIETKVIQNGIDTEYFSPISFDGKQKLRKELNLSNDKILFVSAGALSKRKDPITLIKAFKLSKISNEAQLVILGDGPLYSSCKKIKDDSIILKGHIDNVVDYLRACDVYVSASRSEGLPNSVLEAMGTKLPVLLSDIQQHKEILERNTNIGETFPVGNVKELSSCLSRYLKYDLSGKGNEARKIV
ncbi:glycosyltransferase family 4 protein, partial [bacterium]|nr:glycosyltransferase family 4 protein [bacterium]